MQNNSRQEQKIKAAVHKDRKSNMIFAQQIERGRQTVISTLHRHGHV